MLFFILPVHAESYCVMLDGDNTIVEGEDMHKTQSVASISKIMTAMIALEEGDLQAVWKTGEELKTTYGSSIYLKEGQEVNLKCLLYGLMLRSGNDAALEIAMHIGGSEAEFVKKMNAKAQEIGMLNTVFQNASGLDEKDEGNISTAYDMALLMSYAMKNAQFREIVKSDFYTSAWNYHWKNKNRLLFDFPFANGGKTGFTKKAGRTLVTSAQHDGVESVVVTLGVDDDFTFHKEKHTAVFAAYDVIEILPAGTWQCAGNEIEVKDPLRISVKKEETNAISIQSHFEKDAYIVEVVSKENVMLYTYPIKAQKRTGGWL